jgi:precorrin-2 dehydrogenase/sirohydrochlorin ferrochelatase
MIPLFLNVTNRLCVVIGGGPVGRRKAAALLEGGARVRLVCLEPQPTEDQAAALVWVTEPYHPGHLEGAALVFAAATPEVNRQVIADAHAAGLWVNAASEPENGDFFMPAELRRGDLVVAVGTSGEAPGVARAVRDLLDSQLDDAFGRWLALLAELRPQIQAAIPTPDWRRALLERLAKPEWLDRLRRESSDQVREAMQRELQTLASALPSRPTSTLGDEPGAPASENWPQMNTDEHG